MDNPEKDLLRKFFYNRCSPEELKLVKELLERGVDDDTWLSLLREFDVIETGGALPSHTRERLFSEITAKYAIGRKDKVTVPRLFLQIAAVILVVAVAWYSIGAYLLETQPRFVLHETHENGHRELQTPDGTKIWMNSHSRVHVPENFDRRQRSIVFEGEAFFEVAKDNRPFVLTTQDVVLRVLGTSFNVKSHPYDESIVISLATGHLLIETNRGVHELLPGDEISYHKFSQTITRNTVEPSEASSWRNGWLVFSSASLYDIAKSLERSFHMTIIVDDKLKDRRLTLKQKDVSLVKILEVICFSAGCGFQREGTTVNIKPL